MSSRVDQTSSDFRVALRLVSLTAIFFLGPLFFGIILAGGGIAGFLWVSLGFLLAVGVFLVFSGKGTLDGGEY